jgi:N-acetylglutamate synthase-like GNAT family acetyltransferase
MEKVVIRKANREELEWINSKYSQIDFVHSNFEKEIIAIAEHEGERCGLGRIVTIDETNCELGGMFVFEEFRGMKIAEKIIAFLLDQENGIHKNIWCLPFAKLNDFYAKFGFEDNIVKDIEVPKAVLEKYNWCNTTYDDEVLLLVK